MEEKAEGGRQAELPRELLREAGVRAGASEDREDHDGQEERQHGEQHRAPATVAARRRALCASRIAERVAPNLRGESAGPLSQLLSWKTLAHNR